MWSVFFLHLLTSFYHFHSKFFIEVACIPGSAVWAAGSWKFSPFEACDRKFQSLIRNIKFKKQEAVENRIANIVRTYIYIYIFTCMYMCMKKTMNIIATKKALFRFCFHTPKSWSENDRPPQPDSIPSFQPRGRCFPHDSDGSDMCWKLGSRCFCLFFLVWYASDYPKSMFFFGYASDYPYYPCPDFDPLKTV